MPDHVHALVAGTSSTSDLLELVKDFKQRAGYKFQRTTGQKLWQFNYYDHILRRTDRAEAVAWYIWLNPVRKGICKSLWNTGTQDHFLRLECKCGSR
jgi:REP element-mobilizing transposase RayT